MNKVIQQKVQVHFEYPVVFTQDVFGSSNRTLVDVLGRAVEEHPSPRLVVFIEESVVAGHPDLPVKIASRLGESLPRLALAAPPMVLRGGESLKADRAAVGQMLEEIARARIDRHSFVMGIGGGAFLDVVGYAASLVHRGVRLVRLPTTVLAQNDGGVGVKTAINDPAGKNFLGTFSPPFAVINDLAFLATVPDDAWRGGIAEAFKVALIRDARFFDWLCDKAPALGGRDRDVMEELIFRCAELHLRHIREGGDPFELGHARPLDYGHWSAHQLEAMTGYGLDHGRAVAIGIMVDALYACRSGWLRVAEADRLFLGLMQSGFTLWHEALEILDGVGRPMVIEGLERFREHLGGRLSLTMPEGVGASREISSVDEHVMIAALGDLQARCAAAAK